MNLERSALARAAFGRLLTIAEYQALGEIEFGYSELQEGRVLMSPNQDIRHALAAQRFADQLARQLPAGVELIARVDIDLELAPADQPGSSRRPDLMVVDQACLPRVQAEGGMIRASEVVMAIEVAARGSRRTDHVLKRHDYADAGIPHYWILDIDKPISLFPCRLTERFGYQDQSRATGAFSTSTPFPVTVDLSRLD
ncbi:Uma2 family endonuclease [Crossiella cryophila]|uniref:Uma2 family endonuclease n=1 Tax=Crossiella cryophila TaxID=43355 RepID=A0A7W7FS38_9PSEU|nr:Uma2 family endonuclease [Crossiella cryophila]MBB4676686.1 Uma2 family endonuclease [Crossiella cryophila]